MANQNTKDKIWQTKIQQNTKFKIWKTKIQNTKYGQPKYSGM